MKEHAPKPKQNAVASFDFVCAVQSQSTCVENLMLVHTKLVTTMGKLSGFSRYSIQGDCCHVPGGCYMVSV